jgi:hypothetical protein
MGEKDDKQRAERASFALISFEVQPNDKLIRWQILKGVKIVYEGVYYRGEQKKVFILAVQKF